MKGSFCFRARRAFSLIEVLLSLAILALLASIASISFLSYQREEALNSEAQSLISVLRLARERTIALEDNKAWGVHFEIHPSNKYVLFRDEGNGYNGATLKIFYSTGNSVAIDSLSLNGGGQDVIFEKLTGQTSNYGTGDNYQAIVLKDRRGVAKSVLISPLGRIDLK